MFRWRPYWIVPNPATRGTPQLVCDGFWKPYIHIYHHAKFQKLVTKCTIQPLCGIFLPCYMCISIMCPKGFISGHRVKVAAELVMPSGLLYRKSDLLHYNVIKWKRILRYCPHVGGIHPSTVDSLHKGAVIRTLEVSVLFVWTKCWTNSLLTGDSRRHNGLLTSLYCLWVRLYLCFITKLIDVISKPFSTNVT